MHRGRDGIKREKLQEIMVITKTMTSENMRNNFPIHLLFHIHSLLHGIYALFFH